MAWSTVVRALKVAFVVTPILTVFNHAQDIITLNFGFRFAVQVLLTFCVPYMVSTYSSAMTEIKNAREGGRIADGAVSMVESGG